MSLRISYKVCSGPKKAQLAGGGKAAERYQMKKKSFSESDCVVWEGRNELQGRKAKSQADNYKISGG